MPHTYIKEVAIVGMEIRSAVQAFNAGTEYQPISPYVIRWDRTILPMPGQINPERETGWLASYCLPSLIGFWQFGSAHWLPDFA